MIMQLFSKKKELTFERTYGAPIDAVWQAWTDPDAIRQWWGVKDTTVPVCEVDLRIGGTIHMVMEAGEGMGKYRGTLWPMQGTFTEIERPTRLAYEARSWTEGEEETSTIHHTNQITLTETEEGTVVNLKISISHISSGAKMAVMGMKWGYKAYLDKLETYLTRQS